MANLPPIVVETSGKFAAGIVSSMPDINDTSSTGGKICRVTLILMVHLDLRISLSKYLNKFEIPNVIFRGLGEDDS